MAFTARTETYVDLASLSDPFDITVTKPTNTVNGDILFCWIGWRNGGTIDSAPSGWTLLGDYTANADKYALYYKIADSEGESWVWSFSATARVRAVCSCYTGGDFDPADPIDVVSNTAYREPDDICRAASMTVAASNSPLVFWAACGASNARTFTKPAVPTTDWVEDDDAGGFDADLWTEVCSFIWSGSGATEDMDAIMSAAAGYKHAFAVALNPVAGGETHYGAATLSGTGTLVAKGVGVFIGKSTLSGIGTLSAIGSFLHQAKASLSGTGSLVAVAVGIFIGKATLTGSGSLTASGSFLRIAKATLSGVGTLTASAVTILIGKATLAGTGTLSAIGQVIGGAIKYGKATLTGAGTLTVNAVLTAIGKATLAGVGTLTIIGQAIKPPRFGRPTPRSIPSFSRSNIQVAERHNIQEANRHNIQGSKR